MSERHVTRRRVLAAGSAVAAGSLLWPRSAAADTARQSSRPRPRFPHTDPDNQGGWVFRGDISDEFTGNSVNPAQWYTTPNSWTIWRWDSDNVEVSDGTAKIRSRWNPSDEYNADPPIGWTSNVTGGTEPETQFGPRRPAYITTRYNSGGDADLVHHLDWPYRVSSNAVVEGLADGSYTLRARVRSSGGQYETRMSVSSFDGPGTRMDAQISRSRGYVLYEIDNINVTSGEATLSFYSDSAAEKWLRIRDVEFVRHGTSTNLAPNPGFRQRATLNFDSGILRSRHRIKYGYFEARIKGHNPWAPASPAFWLAYGAPCDDIDKWTELDVVEIGLGPDAPHSITHANHIWRHPCLDGPAQHGAFRPTVPFHPSDDFHTYALEWDEEQVTWYVDGAQHRTMPTQPYYDQPLVMMLSQGLGPSRGNQTPEGFPTTMEVDYVRVWQKVGTPRVGTDPCECPPWQGFTETFDDTPIGEIPPEYDGFGTGGTITVAESPDGADAGHVLSLVRSTTAGSLYTVRPIRSIGAPLRFTAAIRLSQVNTAFGVAVRGDESTARIRFSPDGVLDYEQDGTLIPTSVSYEPDRWYAVEISINGDGLFTASIDGNPFATDIPVGSNGTFDELSFGLGSQALGSVVVDNVSITPG